MCVHVVFNKTVNSVAKVTKEFGSFRRISRVSSFFHISMGQNMSLFTTLFFVFQDIKSMDDLSHLPLVNWSSSLLQVPSKSG